MSISPAGRTGGAAPRPPRYLPVSGLAAGCPVTTLDGVLPVEFLHAGDRVVVQGGGVARVRAITARPVRRRDLLRVTPAVLRPGRDFPAFLVARNQPVLLRDWRARVLFGRERALVPARQLIDGEYFRREPGRGETVLYLLHFDRLQILRAGPLEVASTPLPGLVRAGRRKDPASG